MNRPDSQWLHNHAGYIYEALCRQLPYIDDRETVIRALLKNWNIDATAEVEHARKQFEKTRNINRYTRAGHKIEEPDAPGVFV